MTLHSVSNILVLLLAAALTSNASFIPRQAAGSSDGAGLGPGATLSTADPTGGGGVYGPGATAGIASPSTTPTATGTTSPSITDRPGLSTADPTGGGGVFGPGATDPTPSSQTRSYNFYPSGIQKGSGTIEAALPLECSQYCLMPAGAYFRCFVYQMEPVTNTTVSQDKCDDYFCQPESFNYLAACLNCIVANGDERPFGYHTNTALTAARSLSPALTAVGAQDNPNGLVNAEQARGWLRNVTERCDSIGRGLGSVGGVDKLTAVPTTTGPYYTSYTSGQDLTLTTWTGLAQYATASTPTLFDSVLQTSSASPGSAGAGPSGSQSAGAGTPSGAAGLSAEIPKMGGWLLSGLLGWALL